MFQFLCFVATWFSYSCRILLFGVLQNCAPNGTWFFLCLTTCWKLLCAPFFGHDGFFPYRMMTEAISYYFLSMPSSAMLLSLLGCRCAYPGLGGKTIYAGGGTFHNTVYSATFISLCLKGSFSSTSKFQFHVLLLPSLFWYWLWFGLAAWVWEICVLVVYSVFCNKNNS